MDGENDHLIVFGLNERQKVASFRVAKKKKKSMASVWLHQYTCVYVSALHLRMLSAGSSAGSLLQMIVLWAYICVITV